ncbi:MAG: nucleotidyltransferase domain-containing protein [Acidobacteriota bacterium]
MRLARHTMDEAQRQSIRGKISQTLREKEEILFAIVHGSFQEGLAFRDIDIGIYLDSRLSEESVFEKECGYSLELEDRLGLPVDVKILNRASLGFQYALSSGELLFSRDSNAFYDFRERVWSRYLDHKYFYEQSLKDLLAS